MSKGRALALSAGIVTIATFSGRIFGFIREMVISNRFGASAETDAFFVAFMIPNIIYSLVVMGALSASFIPIFSGLLAHEKEKEAWHLAYTIFNLLLIFFGLIATILIIFAPHVIFLIAPGLSSGSGGQPGQLELAASLLRLMAPALILMGISGLMAGALNSYNHFSTPSMVALVQNILMVISILILADKIGIYGAAIGLLLGAAGQVLIQLPAFVKRKLPYRLVIDLSHDKVVSVGKLFLPVLAALAASQSNIVIDKWFASFLATGSISYLNYAYKVASLPLGTLVAAIAIVLFPTLSQHAAKKDINALRNTISLGIRVIALAAVPASVGLFVLSIPITSLLFEHGAFERNATLATASALSAYSFGILAMGLNMLLVRAFYALQDGMTPLKAAVAFIFLLISLDLFFVRFLAHVGLAAGYTIAVSLMALILLRALQRRLQGLNGVQVVRSFVKIAAAAVAMGVVTWLASDYLATILSAGSKLNELIIVSLSILAGIITYVFVLIVMRTSEIVMLWRMVRSRISRSQPQVA
ncbi:MAG: murein biosynthesis integral membrane protein MurJ [Actinobacteria bacterium]|nr:murein biosynthesis integral membrane protein MurJ [Actinomycetota bacterium]